MTTCPLCGGSEYRALLDCEDHLVSGERFEILGCAHCGLLSTSPAPGPERIWSYYDSETYTPLTGRAPRAYRVARAVANRVKHRWIRRAGHDGGRVLDVGCGTGEFLAYLRARGWLDCGVEPHEGARRLAARSGARILSSLDALEQGEHFDLVTLWNVIEHVHDPHALLLRIREFVATRGLLVVACPNPESTDAECLGRDWYAWDVPRHLWHFTPSTMSHFLGRAGFRLELLRPMPFDPFYITLSSPTPRHRALAIGVRSWLTGLRVPQRSSAIAYLARPRH